MKVNQNSDFDFIFRLLFADGSELGLPLIDWTATFYVGEQLTPSLTAKRVAGKYVSCFEDEGRVHVIADNHSLPRGRVNCRFETDIPDENFPDGTRHLCAVCPTDIEVSRDPSEDFGTFDAAITLPAAFAAMTAQPAPEPIDPLAILTDIAAGKARIAQALRDKGVECSADESLDSLADKIASINVSQPTE